MKMPMGPILSKKSNSQIAKSKNNFFREIVKQNLKITPKTQAYTKSPPHSVNLITINLIE